jgi:PAS domain S-box-containing protein
MGESTKPVSNPDTQLFRDVFNASPIGIVVESLEGQLLFVNPAFCSFLGFSEEELRNKHCVDFSPPEDAEKDWQFFQRLKAGSIDHYQMEKRYFRRDGSLVWGSLSISLLNSPSPLVLAMVEDITDKKKAEEARFRHAAVIESSDDAIASGTLDGIIVSWNAGAQKMYGYTEAEAVGKSITMLFPPELAHEESKILETLRAGGRIEHFETVRVTKAGKRINVSLSISPIKDSSGRTVGISGIARDITERKRAEEVLQETNRALEKQAAMLQAGEALLKIFVKNVPAGVAMLNREMRYLQVSDRWCADYGAEASQILGRSHYEAFPDVPDRWKEAHRRCLEGETLRADEDRWDRAGGTTWVRWEIRPWKTPTGSIGGILIFAEDITRSKQGDEALRASEERLRLAQWAAHIGTFDLNIRTGVDVWQPETEALYGLPPGGFGGTLTAFEDLIHPNDRERVIELTQEMMRTGQPAEAEWRVVWPDGSVHWIAGRGQVLMDESGEPSRMLGVNMDVTERKLAERALVEMTRKLIEAQEQERARIGRELHDDINQRVAMLAIEIEQLQEHHPDIRSRLEEIRKQMTEISDDVQALSHDLHSSKLEYLGVVAGIKSWCKEFAERQKMEIDFRNDVSSVLPLEVGVCLFRVLQEALHNAVKHSGVKRIEMQLAEQSNEVHLIISDSGRGFDVEAALRGKGLGLTSMRERVRLVNGTISIDSKAMGGTRIHVRVPLESAHRVQRAAG